MRTYLYGGYEELIEEKNKEIDRLNNVINELEKYIGEEWYCFDNESVEFMVARDILDKMKELKENKQYDSLVQKVENQQKEFISYLENEIDICDGFLDTVKSDLQEIPYGVISAGKTYITTQIKENETTHKVYEEILQKYREIIGVER